jgi:outer membrane protein OmpA-like peptidoglycan-associated protein
VAAILTHCPGVHLTIAGYTDDIGTPESNLRLSQDRAHSVMAALVGMGVPEDRLSVEGHGENKPVADNATEKGRAENRRVAMRVTRR